MRNRLFASFVALLAGVLVFFTAGPALATGPSLPNPGPGVKSLLSKVGATHKAGARRTSSARRPSQNAPNPPAVNGNSPGHNIANPKRPDHGSAYILHSALAGKSLVRIGDSKSTINDNNSSSADTTLLAVGGQEIAGSHARSNGKRYDSTNPLLPVCTGTGGKVCISLLYDYATATNSGNSSDSSSGAGLAGVCLGGTDTTGLPQNCNGPVKAGIANAYSGAHRNHSTGRTTAYSNSDVANLCVNPTPTNEGCLLGATALSSHGKADSNRSASRGSSLAGVQINGTNHPVVTGPLAIAVPPGCTTPSLVCAFFNQGETYFGPQLAGTAQNALEVTALTFPGMPSLVAVTAAHSETLVHNAGAAPTHVTPPQAGHEPGDNADTTAPKDADNAGAVASALGSVLPNTGGVWSGLLAIAFLMLGMGAALLTWERRRTALAG
ncbi:MAG: hypothetical protein M3130_01775 [Actinomycetota bacterium]|nr:hypothetical protein [Actinomycetota bacterium]